MPRTHQNCPGKDIIMHTIQILIVFGFHIISMGFRIQVPDISNLNYTTLGEFNFGVVLSVHHPQLATLRCDKRVRDIGLLQRLEAIVYAIDEINNSSDLLPNHTLGYTIFDDCYRDTTALAQSLHFSRIIAPVTCLTADINDQCNSNDPIQVVDVVGVIGSESSSSTYSMGQLLTTYQKPQLSYLSTTPVLSEKNRFPYFGRTVSSDSIQAKVIAQLLRHYNWTYVSLVYSEGLYGSGAYKAIKHEASQVDICFSQEYEIKENFAETEYRDVVQSLLLEPRSRIVVAFIPSFTGRKLLEWADRLFHSGLITWIAADAWLRDPGLHSMGNLAEVAKGALSINIRANNVPRFDTYFQTLGVSTALRNPWMDEFLLQYFKCNSSSCDSQVGIASHPDYAPETTVSLVFDTVYAYAHALDILVRECSEGTVANKTFMECVKENVTSALKNVQFMSESGDVFQFNENMDRRSTYDIYNIQGLENGSYGLVRIAEWKPDIARLNFFDNKVEWPRGVQPTSQCSVQCGVGEAKLMEAQKCCWTCIRCEPNQVVCSTRFGNEKCEACGNMTWPDAEKRIRCVAIIPTFVKWDDPMAIAMSALGASGIAVCILIAIVYIINNNHALIKACSRELSYFMLFGLLCSFAFVFTFISEPTTASCSASMFGVGICFTIIYVPLTTKTIRIWRIFQSGRKMDRNPRFVNSKSQMVICTTTVVGVGLIVGLWTYLSYMREEDMIIETGDGKAEKMCRFPQGAFITSIGINVLFLVICSVFAFKTRSLPDNFNESKFIVFCVYSTCVLWIAFVSAYFLTESVYRVLFLSIMEIANATVFICSLFVPKIYAIYFLEKTDLNIRGYQGRPSQFLDEENGREVCTTDHIKGFKSPTEEDSKGNKKNNGSGSPKVTDAKIYSKVAPTGTTAPTGKVTPTSSGAPPVVPNKKVAPAGKTSLKGKMDPKRSAAPPGKVVPEDKVDTMSKVVPKKGVSPTDKVAPTSKASSKGKVGANSSAAPPGKLNQAGKIDTMGKVSPTSKMTPTGKEATTSKVASTGKEQKDLVKVEEKKANVKNKESGETQHRHSDNSTENTTPVKEEAKMSDTDLKLNKSKTQAATNQQTTKLDSKPSGVNEMATKDSDKIVKDLTTPSKTTAKNSDANSPGDGGKTVIKPTPSKGLGPKRNTDSPKNRPLSSSSKTMSNLTKLFAGKGRHRTGTVSHERGNKYTGKTDTNSSQTMKK